MNENETDALKRQLAEDGFLLLGGFRPADGDSYPAALDTVVMRRRCFSSAMRERHCGMRSPEPPSFPTVRPIRSIATPGARFRGPRPNSKWPSSFPSSVHTNHFKAVHWPSTAVPKAPWGRSPIVNTAPGRGFVPRSFRRGESPASSKTTRRAPIRHATTGPACPPARRMLFP